jgi:hypothetical protein
VSENNRMSYNNYLLYLEGKMSTLTN